MAPILIVDDSREDLLLTRRVLAQCRIVNPVHMFQSGEECISYFEGQGIHTGRVLPCILFLDMFMAPLSGVEVLRRLKGIPAAASSVRIMLSGLTDIRKIHEGYQLGAHTFLMKPLDDEDVMHTFRSMRGISATATAEGYLLSLPSHRNLATSN